MEATIKCSTCKEVKSADNFYKSRIEKFKKKKTSQCKSCASKKDLIFRRSKDGWAFNIYKRQRRSSRERKHPLPDYSLKELKQWVFTQDVFHELHEEWVISGYNVKKIPSLDRLDDYKPYTLDNLRVVTWEVNDKRYHQDRANGINNKQNSPVKQYSQKGEFIAEYFSHGQAAKAVGGYTKSITACKKGKLKTHRGFIWRDC